MTMLDMTSQPLPTPAWHTALARGDVVLFRFPHAEPGGGVTPKSRACLVLEIERRGSRVFAELAFGTSAESAANVGGEIHVSTPGGMAAAGLHRPTRFVTQRRVTVSLNHPGWDLTPRHASPVIGHLDRQSTERMNVLRAGIHARRDIAAERRRERSGKRPNRRPPTVELRSSRRRRAARKAAGRAARRRA
jgi:hypothetical protein